LPRAHHARDGIVIFTAAIAELEQIEEIFDERVAAKA
jgi:hypothetical protein